MLKSDILCGCLTRVPPRGRSTLADREPNISTYVDPALFRYMSISLLNMLSLFAPTQLADRYSVRFVYCSLWKVFLSLHWFFAIVTSCPLVLLSSLTETNISINIIITNQYFKRFYLISEFPGF